MDNLVRLIDFLDRLEAAKIFYGLKKIRDSVLVEIAVPGERWEVEFMKDGGIEIEKFISTGHIYDGVELDCLFKKTMNKYGE